MRAKACHSVTLQPLYMTMINGITNETFDVKTNNGARLQTGFQVFHLERKKGDCFRLTEIDQRVTNKSMREIREAFKQYRRKN